MPLIPFIFGAAVGAAILYVAKDDSSQQLVKDSSGKITGSIGALTGKVTSIFKKSEEAVEEKVADTKDAVAAKAKKAKAKA